MSAKSANPFEILGVSRAATAQEIRTQYRKLALQLHPDKTQNDENAQQRFLEVQAAYELLTKAEMKAEFARVESEYAQCHHYSVEIPITELQFDSKEDFYFALCRCGGLFCVYQDELDDGIDIFPCDACSLQARVTCCT